MCPACVASAAILAISATSGGGFAVIVLYRIREWKELWRRVSTRKGKEN